MVIRLPLLFEIRDDFEKKRVDVALLQSLYQAYNPIPAIEQFVQQALEMFPNLNCGLASVYIQHTFGGGEVKKGYYGTHPHTFLLLGEKIIDITADQFGGPRIYQGPLCSPWRNYP